MRSAGSWKKNRNIATVRRTALVVQRIGRKIADLVIEVRFLTRAPRKKNTCRTAGVFKRLF